MKCDVCDREVPINPHWQLGQHGPGPDGLFPCPGSGKTTLTGEEVLF